MEQTDPANPTDRPLRDVVDRADRGADGGFRTMPGSQVRCLTCHRDFPAAGIDADRLTRLEGASDPADMVVVVPVTCPNCGTAGSLVLSYGPDASAEDGDAIRAMNRVPARDGGAAERASDGA